MAKRFAPASERLASAMRPARPPQDAAVTGGLGVVLLLIGGITG